MNLIQTPLDHPEQESMRIRDSLLVVAKAFYFVHHVLICTYSIMLLILEEQMFKKLSFSLLLVIFYGLLAVELVVFNFICIVNYRKTLDHKKGQNCCLVQSFYRQNLNHIVPHPCFDRICSWSFSRTTLSPHLHALLQFCQHYNIDLWTLQLHVGAPWIPFLYLSQSRFGITFKKCLG